jgi:hypothetical protein
MSSTEKTQQCVTALSLLPKAEAAAARAAEAPVEAVEAEAAVAALEAVEAEAAVAALEAAVVAEAAATGAAEVAVYGLGLSRSARKVWLV